VLHFFGSPNSVENEGEEDYNKAPTQKSQNFTGISGFSWAEVAARNLQTSASRASTNVSKLTGMTHANPQQDEIKKLKETLKAMEEQIKNLTALTAQQMNPTQNQAGYGAYYQQPQAVTAQMPPQYRQWLASQSTPSRTNGGRGGGRGSHIN
jgi:hypothetical protein